MDTTCREFSDRSGACCRVPGQYNRDFDNELNNEFDDEFNNELNHGDDGHNRHDRNDGRPAAALGRFKRRQITQVPGSREALSVRAAFGSIKAASRYNVQTCH